MSTVAVPAAGPPTIARGPRVVVSGLELTTPLGTTAGTHWRALLERRRAFERNDELERAGYPVSIGGQIDRLALGEADDTDAAMPRRLLPQTDQITRAALHMAYGALNDAQLDADDLGGYEVGAAISSVTGGLEFGQRQLQHMWADGWREVSPYMSFAWFYAVQTGQISIRHGLKGPSGVVLAEQAGGLDSVAFSCRRVRRGTSFMLTGGIDSLRCPYGMAAVSTADGAATFTGPECYAPFAPNSRGYLPGEGGALLVLEAEDGARERGIRPYGYIASHAATFDPGGAGDGLYRAAKQALDRVGLYPEEIDVVFADAHGGPVEDAEEIDVLVRLFGPGGVPVTSPTPGTGRMKGGGSAVSLATALLSFSHETIPPTPLSDTAVHDDRLDLVKTPRADAPRTALILARGHGGFASAVVATAD